MKRRSTCLLATLTSFLSSLQEMTLGTFDFCSSSLNGLHRRRTWTLTSFSLSRREEKEEEEEESGRLLSGRGVRNGAGDGITPTPLFLVTSGVKDITTWCWMFWEKKSKNGKSLLNSNRKSKRWIQIHLQKHKPGRGKFEFRIERKSFRVLWDSQRWEPFFFFFWFEIWKVTVWETPSGVCYMLHTQRKWIWARLVLKFELLDQYH